MADDVYAKIDIPGVGEKQVLIVSEPANIADYGALDDVYVTLASGKRAFLVLSYISELATLKIGDVEAGNYSEFEADNGFLSYHGTNSPWDDLSGALAGARLDTASGRLDIDWFNGGVNFNSNARYPEEPVIIPVQAKHAMLIGAGAVFRPHFHWLQNQAARPNMLLGVKLTSYGAPTTFETDWSNYAFSIPTHDAFVYPGSGTFAQISVFPEIDISSLTISGSIDIVLFRDTANASGLFPGVDPIAGDVTIKYNDGHVKFNTDGSRQEFVK